MISERSWLVRQGFLQTEIQYQTWAYPSPWWKGLIHWQKQSQMFSDITAEIWVMILTLYLLVKLLVWTTVIVELLHSVQRNCAQRQKPTNPLWWTKTSCDPTTPGAFPPAQGYWLHHRLRYEPVSMLLFMGFFRVSFEIHKESIIWECIHNKWKRLIFQWFMT